MLFSGHSAIDASDTSARAAPGVHVGQPAPKAASKVSHEARRSSEECVGWSHASHAPYFWGGGLLSGSGGWFLLLAYSLAAGA